VRGKGKRRLGAVRRGGQGWGQEVEGGEAGGEHMDSAEELVLFNALGRRGHDEDVVPHDVAVAVPSAHVQHDPAYPPVLSAGPAPP
jgi:hypothetical protein